MRSRHPVERPRISVVEGAQLDHARKLAPLRLPGGEPQSGQIAIELLRVLLDDAADALGQGLPVELHLRAPDLAGGASLETQPLEAHQPQVPRRCQSPGEG